MNAVEDQPPPILIGATGALLLVWGFRKLRRAAPGPESIVATAFGDQGLQP
jgi:hypothetical protein